MQGFDPAIRNLAPIPADEHPGEVLLQVQRRRKASHSLMLVQGGSAPIARYFGGGSGWPLRIACRHMDMRSIIGF